MLCTFANDIGCLVYYSEPYHQSRPVPHLPKTSGFMEVVELVEPWTWMLILFFHVSHVAQASTTIAGRVCGNLAGHWCRWAFALCLGSEEGPLPSWKDAIYDIRYPSSESPHAGWLVGWLVVFQSCVSFCAGRGREIVAFLEWGCQVDPKILWSWLASRSRWGCMEVLQDVAASILVAMCNMRILLEDDGIYPS